jgi:4a-hydroxytetrahydrobiopterin dehydratase
MTKLSTHEIDDALKVLPGWSFHDDKLTKQIEFPGFSDVISFVVKVAFIAEATDHHPDMMITYRHLTFFLSTHTVQGVTEQDLALAKQIEAALNH